MSRNSSISSCSILVTPALTTVRQPLGRWDARPGPVGWLTYFRLAMRVEVPANTAFLTSGWHFSGLRTHVLVAAQRREVRASFLLARELRAADHSE
jgi:hypothetical protein